MLLFELCVNSSKQTMDSATSFQCGELETFTADLNLQPSVSPHKHHQSTQGPVINLLLLLLLLIIIHRNELMN